MSASGHVTEIITLYLPVFFGFLDGVDVHARQGVPANHNLAYSSRLLVPLIAFHEDGEAVDPLEQRRPARTDSSLRFWDGLL